MSKEFQTGSSSQQIVESAKRILFLTPYPQGVAPSQRLKFEQYYPAFREAGYDLSQSAFVSRAFWRVIYQRGHWMAKLWYTLLGYLRRTRDLFRIRRYDIVYIHLWVTPFGPPIFEWLTHLLARKVVFDIDDMTFLGHASRANNFMRWLRGNSKPIYLMKRANHVITCTPRLDEFARRFNENTTDISSTIDTDIYTPRPDYSLNDIVTLGWSGSHSTSHYLHLLDGVFRMLAEDGLRFRLLVIGDESFSIPEVEVQALPWKLESEVNDLLSMDIGLYPLPDEEWVYGKSGLKALQYMALGIPTIATAIGANYRIIEDGVNGFLVKGGDTQAWTQHISRLVRDQALRERIGKAARETVEARYSIKINAPAYLDVLSSVSSKTV